MVITFDEPLRPSSVSTQSVRVLSASGLLPMVPALSADGRTVTLPPVPNQLSILDIGSGIGFPLGGVYGDGGAGIATNGAGMLTMSWSEHRDTTGIRITAVTRHYNR